MATAPDSGSAVIRRVLARIMHYDGIDVQHAQPRGPFPDETCCGMDVEAIPDPVEALNNHILYRHLSYAPGMTGRKCLASCPQPQMQPESSTKDKIGFDCCEVWDIMLPAKAIYLTKRTRSNIIP